jgi:hypothetical protein
MKRSSQEAPAADRGAVNTGDVARLGALVVIQREALAATLQEADATGDELRYTEALRQERKRVCDALRRLETASLTPGPAGLPGRWPEPWDDSEDASARRPSAVADRIARDEGTAAQLRALTAGYRWWTGRMYRLQSDYRNSFVDALMLELVETDRDVRDKVTLAFTRLGEDACMALCAEIRDIEDDGGLWIVETRRRRTKGGVWFSLLKARYAWARSPMPYRRRHPAQEEGDGVAPRVRQAEEGGARAAPSEDPEARPNGRGRDEASSGPPPEGRRAQRTAWLAPVSTMRPRARGASPRVPEVIVLRRRRGAS